MLRSTGIVRNLATGNRCTIPIEITNGWEIGPGDPLEYRIYEDDTLQGVLISPHRIKCAFCGELEDLLEFKGVKLCPVCKNEISKRIQ